MENDTVCNLSDNALLNDTQVFISSTGGHHHENGVQKGVKSFVASLFDQTKSTNQKGEKATDTFSHPPFLFRFPNY